MKKLFVFNLMLISFGVPSFAQSSLLEKIEDQLEDMLRKDAKTWMISTYEYNSLVVNDGEQKDDGYEVEGTFVVDYESMLINGKKTIHYTAEVKIVIDDVRPKKLWYTQPYTNNYRCIGTCD